MICLVKCQCQSCINWGLVWPLLSLTSFALCLGFFRDWMTGLVKFSSYIWCPGFCSAQEAADWLIVGHSCCWLAESGVRCPVSCVWCPVSGVRFPVVSGVRFWCLVSCFGVQKWAVVPLGAEHFYFIEINIIKLYKGCHCWHMGNNFAEMCKLNGLMLINQIPPSMVCTADRQWSYVSYVHTRWWYSILDK